MGRLGGDPKMIGSLRQHSLTIAYAIAADFKSQALPSEGSFSFSFRPHVAKDVFPKRERLLVVLLKEAALVKS